MVLDGTGGDFFHRRFADTTPRKTNDTKQRFVIVSVDGQTKVTECILNFFALVERRAAIDAVRDIEFAQLPFDDTTLRVRAIEHSE